jgi:hypothetical protein
MCFTFAKKMNALTYTSIFLMACSIALGGGPIHLSETKACADADVVLIANVKALEDVHKGDFGDFEHLDPDDGSPYTKFAKIDHYRLVMGRPPKTLKIYGGKFATMTHFRIETGESLILLKKIGEDGYRSVDWNHGFMPVKKGQVEWPDPTDPTKTEWIPIDKALTRIKAHKKESEQAAPRSR